MILNKKLFLKSMFLNKNFVKSMIFNQIFFVFWDFESKFFRLVRFRVNFFYNASDFKSFFWTRVRFWLETFTARQILSVLLLQFGKFSCVHHNMSRFRNVLRYSVGSFGQVFFKKHDFELKFSLRDRFWIEKNKTRHILKRKKNNASDFEIKKLRRFNFWINKNTTRQILSEKFYNVSDFESIPFAVCQIFLHSSREGMFR